MSKFNWGRMAALIKKSFAGVILCVVWYFKNFLFDNS
jgi:hypothetical protein